MTSAAFFPRTARRAVRCLHAWIVGGVALVTAIGATALPLQSGGRPVHLVAREQPVAAFMQDLFGQIDVPVSVSPSATGAVNGTFKGEADVVARHVARAFGLVLYHDGSVMHVQAAGDMVSRTLASSAPVAEKVVRAASEMRMTDRQNTVRSTRDGAIVISGTRRFVEQVEELARASQVTQTSRSPLGFKVFYLRYAWAQDVTVNFGGRQVVLPGVATTIRSLVTSSARSPASLLAQEQTLRPTQPKLKGQGLGREQPMLGLPEAQGRSGNGDALQAAHGPAAGGGVPGGAASVMLGDLQQVRIEADTRLNAVIVRDAPERLAYYEQLVQSLDVEPQSLEIEATIIDVNTDRLRELGVNWRGNAGRSSVLFGNGTESDLRLQPGGSVIGSAITPAARGGVISAVLGDAAQFVARISALQTEGAARVVSSPQVVTLSNVEAIFDSSTTFYVRVAGRDEVDLFNVSAGTSMRVTPHVFKDADGVRIKLLVNLEDGAVSDARVDAIPVVSRSSINTQALIYEGESLLIGGLTRESSGRGRDKVPFLGDIPLLGRLFTTERDSGARIERMFLISPRLSARRSVAIGPAPALPASAPTRVAPPSPEGAASSVVGSLPAAVPAPWRQVAPPSAAAPAVVATPSPGLSAPPAAGQERPADLQRTRTGTISDDTRMRALAQADRAASRSRPRPVGGEALCLYTQCPPGAAAPLARLNLASQGARRP